jgi:hypothetical protein
MTSRPLYFIYISGLKLVKRSKVGYPRAWKYTAARNLPHLNECSSQWSRRGRVQGRQTVREVNIPPFPNA